MKMPINCCCDAGKLLGFVEVPRGEELHSDDLVSFTTKNGPLQLPKAYVGGLLHSYPALKSMDTPLDVLASIPTFEPYTGTRVNSSAKVREVLGEKHMKGDPTGIAVVIMRLGEALK